MKTICYRIEPHVYNSNLKKNVVPAKLSLILPHPKTNRPIDLRITDGVFRLEDNEDGTFVAHGSSGYPVRMDFDPRPTLYRHPLFQHMTEITEEEAAEVVDKMHERQAKHRVPLVTILTADPVFVPTPVIPAKRPYHHHLKG